MTVVVVEPGYAPYEAEITDSLHEMQKIVGGLIQPIYPFEENVAIVCNEEGILMHLPFNRSVEGGYGGVFGTFFICGLTEDSFCSLTPEQVKHYKEKYHHAEILTGVKGNDVFTIKIPPRQRNQPPRNPGRSAPER